MRGGLLHVLDLFADFFQFGFGVYDELGECGIVGFGADGIKLTVKFLAEEIEGAAHGFIFTEVVAEFFKVRV